MKSNKKFLFIIILFSVPLISKCQINTSTGMDARMQSLIRNTTLYVANPYEDVYGNPYIDEEFREGIIRFKDSTVYNGIAMRLNHNSDEIEFKQDDKILAIPNPEDIVSVSFGDHLFYYLEYMEGKKTRKGYFEVFVLGKTSLLYKRASIIKREQLPPTEMAGKNYRDYFRTVENYYFKKEDEPAFLVYKTSKSILKALSDKEPELKKYINQNKLKIKKKEDLIKLVNYYNSL